jgi:Domain of unknown function (DUF4157)
MSVMRTVRQETPASLRPITARSQTLRRLHHLGTQGQSGRIAENAAQTAAALGGSGQALDSRTRLELEPRFGYDFSSVRVHTDEAAARASRSIGAVAYTAGTDIAFATGRYQPNTASGQALLAHELTHVAQQSHRAADTRSVAVPAPRSGRRTASRPSSPPPARSMVRSRRRRATFSARLLASSAGSWAECWGRAWRRRP